MADSANRFVPDTPSGTRLDHVSRQMAMLEKQLIVQVVEMARDAPGVIPLWFGESDLDTPNLAKDAAIAALTRGETHYTHQNGIPPLRRALADYMAGLYGRDIDTRRITVTSAGMSAIMMALQAVLAAGDHMVIVTPLWPNAFGVCRILGVDYCEVPMSPGEAGWSLDLDRLFAAVQPNTRALYVATPSNPTGWIMEREQQQAVLDFCRARDIWLVADEVYARMIYDRPVAPSFLELADDEDPLVVVNTFSKAWAMTGWRMGWMVAPPSLEKLLADVVQYNTSGTATFLQHGALAAIQSGEGFAEHMRDYCRAGRDIVHDRLQGLNRIALARPEAALYAFLKVDGLTDSLAAAKSLLAETRVGLAPGIAFGAGGEGHLRICFANSTDRLNEALDRLVPALAKL